MCGGKRAVGNDQMFGSVSRRRRRAQERLVAAGTAPRPPAWLPPAPAPRHTIPIRLSVCVRVRVRARACACAREIDQCSKTTCSGGHAQRVVDGMQHTTCRGECGADDVPQTACGEANCSGQRGATDGMRRSALRRQHAADIKQQTACYSRRAAANGSVSGNAADGRGMRARGCEPQGRDLFLPLGRQRRLLRRDNAASARAHACLLCARVCMRMCAMRVAQTGKETTRKRASYSM